MDITPATADDAAGIARVHVRSWQVAYAGILDPDYLQGLDPVKRTDRWREILQQNESQTHVARHQGVVAGFVSFGRCRDEGAPPDRGEIWAIYTLPELWGQGFGKALLQRSLEELAALGCNSVSLWGLSRNQRAIGFYESRGFKPVPDSQKMFELGGRQVEEVCLLR